MDPDAALERLRALSAQLLNGDDYLDTQDAVDFAEQFKALDEWILGGGFGPAEWVNNVGWCLGSPAPARRVGK